MSKKTHIIFMILNAFFVVVNGFFMIVSSTPGVNFYAAMFCLAGVMISYYNWTKSDE
jgi:uncharacterized membrane protein